MKKYIVFGVIVIGILVYGLSGQQESFEDYQKNLAQERVEKDKYMSESIDSPFRTFGDTIVRLKYFPIKEEYKVKAKIEKIETKQYMTLGSSSGEPIKYLKYAYAHFEINKTPLKLLVLKSITDVNGSLFTAFADKTSGDQTYGAGRYIDLDFKNAKQITLDFNTAYNPYCNYNDQYTCPFPPAENILPVAIEAGEMDYKH